MIDYRNTAEMLPVFPPSLNVNMSTIESESCWREPDLKTNKKAKTSKLNLFQICFRRSRNTSGIRSLNSSLAVSSTLKPRAQYT